MAFKFERLIVWQRAAQFSTRIHGLTKTFPKDELYVLTTQIRRAADSISLNIAEGSTGQTNGEFRQFLGYALRSGIEVVGCLHLARSRQLLTETSFQELYQEIEEIVKMVQGLRKSL